MHLFNLLQRVWKRPHKRRQTNEPSDDALGAASTERVPVGSDVSLTCKLIKCTHQCKFKYNTQLNKHQSIICPALGMTCLDNYNRPRHVAMHNYSKLSNMFVLIRDAVNNRLNIFSCPCLVCNQQLLQTKFKGHQWKPEGNSTQEIYHIPPCRLEQLPAQCEYLEHKKQISRAINKPTAGLRERESCANRTE